MNVREWVSMFAENKNDAEVALGLKEYATYDAKMKAAHEIIYNVTYTDNGVLSTNVLKVEPLCYLHAIRILTDIEVDFEHWSEEYDALMISAGEYLRESIMDCANVLDGMCYQLLAEKREQCCMGASVIRLIASLSPTIIDLEDKLSHFDLGYSAEDLGKVIDFTKKMKK